MGAFHNILAVWTWSTAYTFLLLIVAKGVFGVTVTYVLEFLGKLLLLFFVSAVISKILNLNSAYEDHTDKKS